MGRVVAPVEERTSSRPVSRPQVEERTSSRKGKAVATGGSVSAGSSRTCSRAAPACRAGLRRTASWSPVDVNTGKIAWKSTLGIQEALAADLGDKGVKTGTRNLGGSIATASGLVFIAATNDRRFRAFDAKTGAELWSATLPASGHATPMTYMGKDGVQYVVIAASGGTSVGGGLPISDALVAFKLGSPNSR